MTRAIVESRHCAHCEYDLRGLEVARCPECGHAFDPSAPPPAQVPWLVRREIGAFTAYWRTVSMVVLRPRHFAAQALATSSADARGAESFRRITVVLATVSVALAAGLLQMFDTTVPMKDAAQRAFAVGCATAVSLGVFFSIVTMPVRVDLVRPQTWNVVLTFRYLQKFCCAGLGWSPAIVPCAIVAVGAARMGQRSLAVLALVATFWAATTVIAAWWTGGAMYVCNAGKPGAIQAAEALIWWLLLLLAGSLAAAATAILLMNSFVT